jgi:hypothetical protein
MLMLKDSFQQVVRLTFLRIAVTHNRLDEMAAQSIKFLAASTLRTISAHPAHLLIEVINAALL